MLKRVLFGSFAACLLAGLATAQDPFMGIYEGQFTSGAWQGQDTLVQVVPLGKDAYKAVFPFDKETPRAAVIGKKEGSQVAFEDEADLGAAHGGVWSVTARLTGETLTGNFKQGSTAIAFSASKVVRESPTLGAKPPANAVVLLDGTNLDHWQRHPLKWSMVEGGAMQVCGSNLVTKDEFGDALVHIEFRTPFMPEARGQGRGNSGVYVQGRYEVQVLDSFGEEPADNLCGGIYKMAVPAVDATLPPLQWQTYDIEFKAPRFDAQGKKTANAVISVRHNGMLIHDKVELPEWTGGPVQANEQPKGPIMLQDHGNPVRYRNCWVLPQG